MSTAVETLQHEWELAQLLRVYAAEQPQCVLEIGAWEGGTLRHWLGGYPALCVVIDDAMRKADLWRTWAAEHGVRLELLGGHSQAPDVLEQAEVMAPYDWVFIDADHNYEAVLADWQVYHHLVAPGGVVAFHDLRNYSHGRVGDLWAELKPKYRTLEITDMTVPAEWGGIGVLWT